MKLLNIGCGSTFHPVWDNIDIVSLSPLVRQYDIRKGLPYPDASYDACYSSHLLEHLETDVAQRLIGECLRVLKPRGVIRLVVPNLEAIAQIYLDMLAQVAAGNADAEPNYDWIMLELYDQTVRRSVGGEMGRYLRSPAVKNKEFVLSRIGVEAERYWMKQDSGVSKRIQTKFRIQNIFRLIKKGRVGLAKALVSFIAGEQALRSFEEGLFRDSGEIHRWMYDHFSLKRLLVRAGFTHVCVCCADESRITDFNSYNLDVVGGRVRKPDSLFMEGIKP